MTSNQKGKVKGGDGKETVSVGEHTTPVHVPLIHISGYTSHSLSTSRHHPTTQHIHAYNKIYDTNATNFKLLT